ncbi:MAG: CHAD domain-containing protein [Phycisphaerae bacterium]
MGTERDGVAGNGRAAEGESWGDFLRGVLRRRARTLSACAPDVAAGGKPDALHDMRVASRRLRAALAVLEPFLPRRRARRLGKSLRRLTRTLGATREADVLIDSLERLREQSAGVLERAAAEHALEHVHARRAREHARMTRDLADLDAARIQRRFKRLLRDIHPPRTTDDAEFALQILLPRVEGAFGHIDWLRGQEDPPGLHAMRIAIKKLRYAIELLKPAFFSGHAELLARVRGMQDILGHHHDDVLCEELLLRLLDGLVHRARGNLADGMLGLIERARLRRREQYAQFVAASAGWSIEGVLSEIRRGLARGENGVGNGSHTAGGRLAGEPAQMPAQWDGGRSDSASN